MSILKQRITEDMKNAMRAKEAERLSAIRLLLSAMKQREVDERIELSDADIIALVEKELKKRRDSIQQYEAAKRQDLADKEKFEVTVLEVYLPQQLTEAELNAEIDAAIAETGAVGAQGMGKVMAHLKPKLAGRADMSRVSALLKTRLA